MHDRCLNCDKDEHGSKIKDDFICFDCSVISRDGNVHAVTRDSTNWWVRYPKSNRGNEWSRASIDENHAYDEAYEQRIGRLVLE